MKVKWKMNEDQVTKSDQLQTVSNTTMSRSLALLFATACGISVADITYAQPLLDILSYDFKIGHSVIGIIITITQACYALGLLLLVPLGDLLNRRLLIICQMLMSVAALIFVGISSSSTVLFISIAAVGFLATVTQTLVAYASVLSDSKERGRIVGLVTSGIVIGILLARTFAGLLTDLWGWRSVYIASALLLLVTTYLFYQRLPSFKEKRVSLTYPQLLYSVLTLFVHQRILIIRGVLALLIFTVFNILWTSLALPLSAPPYSLSPSAIGSFGLAGVAGALAATRAGRLADKGFEQRTTGIALLLLLASWFLIGFTKYSMLVLIIGVILLDLAVQAVHVINQYMIFTVRPEAGSRLTAAYMIFYSIGSAVGSIVSTDIYANYGWNGVCLLGASVSTLAILFWITTLQLTKKIGNA